MSEPIQQHSVHGVTLFTQEWYNTSSDRQQMTIADENDCFVQAFYDRKGKLHITENVLDNPRRYQSYPGLTRQEVDKFLSLAVLLVDAINNQ